MANEKKWCCLPLPAVPEVMPNLDLLVISLSEKNGSCCILLIYN